MMLLISLKDQTFAKGLSQWIVYQISQACIYFFHSRSSTAGFYIKNKKSHYIADILLFDIYIYTIYIVQICSNIQYICVTVTYLYHAIHIYVNGKGHFIVGCYLYASRPDLLVMVPYYSRYQSSCSEHGAHLGPVDPRWAHVGPMNLAIRDRAMYWKSAWSRSWGCAVNEPRCTPGLACREAGR